MDNPRQHLSCRVCPAVSNNPPCHDPRAITSPSATITRTASEKVLLFRRAPSFIHPSIHPSLGQSLARPSFHLFPPSFLRPTIARHRIAVRLPCVVAKEQPARGDKQADHDGGGRGARDIVGLVPAHGEDRHGAIGRGAPRQARFGDAVAVAGSVGCWRCRASACRWTIGGGLCVRARACVVVWVGGWRDSKSWDSVIWGGREGNGQRDTGDRADRAAGRRTGFSTEISSSF